jgi:hypothetical protein
VTADLTTALFVVLPVLLVAVLAIGVWLAWRRDGQSQAASSRAATLWVVVFGGWMTLTWQVSASGAFRRWEMFPPPLMMLVLGIVLLAVRLTVSPTGRRLATHIPLWALVGVQAFRLPLELAMHQMYERGVMPEQMSYSGLNFDIVTGITAVFVSLLLLARRAGRRLAFAWNILGLLLLANIVTVAILSTPLFGYFGEDRLNTWVTYPPYVWLPAVMVLAALAGHLIIFRAIRAQGRAVVSNQ